MTFFKLLLSALILISACPGYAGEAEWKQHIDAGLSASRQKDWGRAKSQFEEALLAANGNERLSALASIHLGRALQAMKQFESAAHQFRLAVATLEKTGSSDTDSLATAIHQLAFTLASVKEYAEAESLQKRAISLTKTLYGPTDLDVGSREQELGWIYLNWKKYDEAAFAFSRALSIADASSVEKPEFVRQIVVALALVHSYRKDKVAVREYGRRQLKLGERLYGVRSAEVAQDLLDIGFRHDLQGDFEESEASYKRAIQILTTLSLPQNIMRIAALKQLGLLYSGQSRFADAEAVYENANREAKATLGDRHPTTISILRSLSSVYLARGKFDDAARLLDQLQEFEAGLGKNIDELIREITMLSLVRVGQGRYAEAEKGFRSAILLIETARGPDDPELSGLLIMFAYSIGLRGGSLVDVEALDRRALAITEKTVGRNSDAYADRLADLARARQAVGKYEEAEALLLNAVSVKSKLFGENHLKFGPVFSALSSVYVDLGKFKFAAEYATRAVNVLEMGQTTNQLGLARALLAQTAPLLELQYFESSANAAARALAIFNSLLGSAHVETAFSRYRLAAAQAAEGRVAESLETVRLALPMAHK